MKKYHNLFWVLTLTITIAVLTGCQKVINVDLNEAAPHIVIEGLLTDSYYSFRISKSGSYFNQPVLSAVSDALVILTDDKATIDTLKENQYLPGSYYFTNMRAVPGTTYTLKVKSEKQEYSGSSTMHTHVEIDSLKLEKSQQRGFGFGGGGKENISVDVHCYFKDPVEKNFYRIKTYSSRDTARSGNYRLYDDQYTNGEETNVRVGRATNGDTIRIELLSLDKQTYEYYRTLSDLLRTNPIFGSTPANPNTNLSNGALGYFGAAAVSYKSIIITDSLIKTVK